MATEDDFNIEPPDDLKEEVLIFPEGTAPEDSSPPILRSTTESFVITDDSDFTVDETMTTVAANLTLRRGAETISFGPVTRNVQSSQITFEPLETLKDELDALIAAGEPLVLDCAGRHFITTMDRSGFGMSDYEFDFDPSNSSAHKDITIRNGNFYGGFRPDWREGSPQAKAIYGDGVYEADFDYTINDPRPGGGLKAVEPTRRFLWCPNEIAPKIPAFPLSIYDIENPINAGIENGPYHDYQFGRTERFTLTTKSSGPQNQEVSGYLGLADGSRAFEDGSGNPITWGHRNATFEDRIEPTGRIIKTIVVTDPNIIQQTVNHYSTEFGYLLTDPNPVPYEIKFFLNCQTYANVTVIVPIVRLEYDPTQQRLIFTIEDGSEIDEEDYINAGYLTYAFTGVIRALDPGQWTMSEEDQKVYWTPRNGTPTGDEVMGISRQKMFDLYSSVNENKTPYVWPDTVDDRSNGSWLATFENCNFLVTGGNFIEVNIGSKFHLIDIKSCSFTYCSVAVSRGISKIEDSYFNHCLSACANVSDGSVIRRNWWGQSYDKSCFNASCGDYSNRTAGRSGEVIEQNGMPEGNAVPPLKTIVEQNVFYTPSTQHGQGVSFYKNTFMNAVFNNNLIVNTSRAWTNGLDEISTDPTNSRYANPLNTAQSMECNNNLFYANDFVTSIQGFVYNWEVGLRDWCGIDYPVNDYQPGQMVTTYKNNTVFVDRPTVGTFETVCGNGSTTKITNVQYGFQDNMWGKLVLGDRGHSLVAASCVNNSYSHQNNSLHQQGNSRADNVAPPRQSLEDYHNCYVDPNTLQPLGVNLTNASDGGQVGVRWQQIPTVDEIWKIIRREDGFRQPWFTHMVPLPLADDAFDFTDSLTYVDRDTYTGSNTTLCHSREYDIIEQSCP